MLIDTHTHLNARQFAGDLETVIENAQRAGVSKMIVVGFDKETINKAVELIGQYDFIYAAIGWHPVDAIDCTNEDLVWIEELTKHEKVVAIGEIGLDYHWDKSPKDVQQILFRKQIELAKRVNLPIIIHNREATGDLIRILEEENASAVGGIMHCYSGSVETAKQCMKMNFLISLGGPVTFKNAKEPKEVAAFVPLDQLLIETDCPYLAPHPYRGKRNEPAYVKLVAEEIAKIKHVAYEEVASVTSANAIRLLKL